MTSLFDLSGHHALVTGGAQGLGRMIAEELLRAGASVTVTSRKPEALEKAAADMSEIGACIPIEANLASAQDAISFSQRYMSQVGRCSILVNNAGKSWGAPLEEFPDKAWPDILSINVQVPFTLSRELLPLLREAATEDTPSRILNIGSIAGAKVQGLQAYSYSASKAAIHMLSRDLAAEFATEHLTVNTLIPGYFPTKMTAHLRDGEAIDPQTLERIPMRRFGKADEIGGAAVFLCSRAASYITGTALAVDGGILNCS
ncbi:MAG: SDR family oxidoreductase [Pseudomonadota bacterium]